MTDRRSTPATDRVALSRLRGVIDRSSYTEGRPASVTVPLADLCAAPEGARDRQVNFGAPVTVIDEAGGWSFVEAASDGYCGWLPPATLGAPSRITHRVAAPATHVYRHPDIKRGEIASLAIGALLSVEAIEDRFARLAGGGFVPAVHIMDTPSDDPAAVAESLIGTPYLWGGNSRSGIDCSGLVQAALLACGRACPGDSDQQWRAVGTEVPLEVLRRGDLLFWHGHVAMALSADMLIHANGHAMAVSREGVAETLARIEAAGEGDFLGVKRPA